MSTEWMMNEWNHNILQHSGGQMKDRRKKPLENFLLSSLTTFCHPLPPIHAPAIANIKHKVKIKQVSILKRKKTQNHDVRKKKDFEEK